jgi:microcompartment protein CcmK/EutM
MRIGKVIGTVTPGRIHPFLRAGQFKIIRPFTWKDFKKAHSVGALSKDELAPTGEEVVAYDELSVGLGEWVAFSEGAEAAMPFYPDLRPIDVYAGAIIDSMEISEEDLRSLL